MEAQKEITQEFFTGRQVDTALGPTDVGQTIKVEYIRKDIYDEAQARIKELEEALEEYKNRKNWNTVVKLDGRKVHLVYSSLWKNDSKEGWEIAHNVLTKD